MLSSLTSYILKQGHVLYHSLVFKLVFLVISIDLFAFAAVH